MSLRGRVSSYMREKEPGLVPRALLGALSLAYGMGVRARLLAYRTGVLQSRALGLKVVSVGNLTVGGTGKTPVTMFLARFFQEDGRRVAVLSRGYGGSARGAAVVSDGRKVLMGPAEAGDEPYLMAARLEGVPVLVCPDRVKGGQLAAELFSPDVLVLDDAFQHVRLRRDLNIVLVDSKDGFGNGRLLPRGVLREPVSGLRRADFALVKGGPPAGKTWEALKRHSVPYLAFSYRSAGAYNIDTGEELGLERLRGSRALVVSAIADPASFSASLAGLGVVADGRMDFPDHHAYEMKDAGEIERAAAASGMVLTTEKDGVKLKGLVKAAPVYALRIEIDIDDGLFRSALAPLLRGVL